MNTPILNRILMLIEYNWDIFESYLLLPTKLPEFDSFLNSYRGMSLVGRQHSFTREEAASRASEGVLNFFMNIFAKEGLAELDTEEIIYSLQEIEKNVNLVLYYWFGLSDRNYQFRTFIHFFDLNEIGSVFLTKSDLNFSVKLTEDGICFGLMSEDCNPLCLPISKVCALNKNFSNRELFARIRTVQREICLMIDEWEHLNSILAVEYGVVFKNLQKNKNSQSENEYELFLFKMNRRRNTLAQWCLESLCDFQEWIVKLTTSSFVNQHNEDLKAEMEALSALILASLQKILLPASVSKQCYADRVIQLFERFARARLDYCPDDFSTKLLLQATQSAQGKDFSLDLLKIIEQKTFEWKFSFDPSSALKAFSWGYSRKHHLLLCALLNVCYFKKSLPNQFDVLFLSDIVAVIQAQDAFYPFDVANRTVHKNQCSISNEDIQKIFHYIFHFMDKNIKLLKQTEECIKFIKKNFVLMD